MNAPRTGPDRPLNPQDPVDVDERHAPSDRAGRNVAEVGRTFATIIGGAVGGLVSGGVMAVIVLLLVVGEFIPHRETGLVVAALAGCWVVAALGMLLGARTGRRLAISLQARHLRRLDNASPAQLEAHGIGGAGSSMAVPVQSDTRVRR